MLTRSDIEPAKLPYDKAQIILGGTPINVAVSRTTKAPEVLFGYKVHGTQIEEEHFIDLPEGFSFVGINAERYEPAIPLLKFPLTIGDQWSWKGDYLCAEDVKMPCTAKVTVNRESLNRPGAPTDTIRVDVKLSMEENASADMTFWFAKGSGLVMRKIGQSSSREPASPVAR